MKDFQTNFYLQTSISLLLINSKSLENEISANIRQHRKHQSRKITNNLYYENYKPLPKELKELNK